MNHTELLSLSSDFLSRKNNLKKNDILIFREVIREHNRLYHDLESPIISDTEYDELFHALARLESDHHMLDNDSPTAQLAILATNQFQKVKHIYPMISLDNTYNNEEVREWNERMMRILGSPLGQMYDYYIQPKYDGLGLAIIYEYGEFVQAITRGSGVEGEDVTLTAREIVNIPKSIEILRDVGRMEIRGEVMMTRSRFESVNRERLESGDKLFANPRNAASGSLRQLDPLVTRSRELRFFAYAIPQIEQDENEGIYFSIKNYHELMDLLVSWGFERQDFPFRHVSGIDALVDVLVSETEKRKEYFDFDIDGMVLKLDDMSLWNDLGRTEHHPRYAIAYKFPAKQVRTRVVSIEHSVGRTGTVTPVANLEAVEVTGVIVRRATLHNYDELEKKGVREGDQVYIMRAGEVIPEIVSVIVDVRDGSEKEILIPTHCPVCQTELLQDIGKVAIYCPNQHCSAKIQGQLEMFVGRQGMNIDGLGTKQIELFLEEGWITDFASVFELPSYTLEILELEGYKEKSISNLIESLEKSRHTTLDRVFTAIGIPNVGKKTARLIATVVTRSESISENHTEIQISENSEIESICTLQGPNEALLQKIFSITEENLLEVKDIGPETARSFVEYMENNREIVVRLFQKLDIQIPETRFLHAQEGQIPSCNSLSEKSFCVTGSFENISREAIHELIEKNGGEVRTAVTGKLDYLIVGENAGSKKTKAESLGVKIITIEEFMELIV
ncbi:NAD-dependent DNA ligase LigA [Candidatus Gracilibacteria bacterium]|nr:NAD-dependent DNA ligase LigA [Candidatus Gracilibacteria bacterium]